MRILQINTTANSASHGRIAAGIGKQLILGGHESYIAYGRTGKSSESELIKIGGRIDQSLHLIKSRLFDRHCFGSYHSTSSFIKEIEKTDPDIIHLHNIHGYYLNIVVLFRYLKNWGKPVIWTFHDTWPISGHCSFFEHMNCYKWQKECFECPNIHGYPKSLYIDNSRRNYREKKELFTGLNDLVLVSPSEWLANHLKNSFLSGFEIRIINNGVDINKFSPEIDQTAGKKYLLKKKYILGVANIWDERKGLKDFVNLRKILDREIDIVLVGLSQRQINSLDDGIKGICRTESIEDLASLYAGAEIFVNPTYLDNFPLVNIEALACGTPVITYRTGGSPESIDKNSGLTVEKGNVQALHGSVMTVLNEKNFYSAGQCRERAISKFSSEARNADYIDLYHERLMHSPI